LALEAAKKNLDGDNVQRVLSDGWTSLDASKRFDLILSNPPVHLGLAADFAPLREFLRGLPLRLTDDGVAYFVAQRYVPTRSLTADIDGLRVERDLLDPRFVVWRCARAP
jgi:16S RNA G1207 methylase RsmC